MTSEGRVPSSQDDIEPAMSGRVLPADWCLTCRSYVTRLNEHATHDVICEPPAGWESCNCRYCRRVVEQMTTPARESR